MRRRGLKLGGRRDIQGELKDLKSRGAIGVLGVLAGVALCLALQLVFTHAHINRRTRAAAAVVSHEVDRDRSRYGSHTALASHDGHAGGLSLEESRRDSSRDDVYGTARHGTGWQGTGHRMAEEEVDAEADSAVKGEEEATEGQEVEEHSEVAAEADSAVKGEEVTEGQEVEEHSEAAAEADSAVKGEEVTEGQEVEEHSEVEELHGGRTPSLDNDDGAADEPEHKKAEKEQEEVEASPAREPATAESSVGEVESGPGHTASSHVNKSGTAREDLVYLREGINRFHDIASNIVDVPGFEPKLVVVPRNDELMGPSVLHSGQVWEQHLLVEMLEHVPEGGTVLDVGANYGSYTLFFAEAVGSRGQVWAWEPQQLLYRLMCMNLALNQITNVHTTHGGVGHVAQDTTMAAKLTDGSAVEFSRRKPRGQRSAYFKDLSEQNSLINFGGRKLGKGGERTRIYSLDELGLTGVSFMKVDVEGAEPLVFWGARETIRRERPVIFYESNYQTVTKDMRDMEGVNQTVATFDVRHWVETELNYTAQKIDKSQDWALFPPGYGGRFRPRGHVRGVTKDRGNGGNETRQVDTPKVERRRTRGQALRDKAKQHLEATQLRIQKSALRGH